MHLSQDAWQTDCRLSCACAARVGKVIGTQKASAATVVCPGRSVRFILSPQKSFRNSGYWLHGCSGIKAKPNTPCEPTSEMALALIGEHVCACARGTLSDEAGALPIKIIAATVARILVVRMGSRPKRELSGLDLRPKR